MEAQQDTMEEHILSTLFGVGVIHAPICIYYNLDLVDVMCL